MAKEEADELMTSLNDTAGVSYVNGVEVPIEAAARAEGLRKRLTAPTLTKGAFRALALKHVDEAELAEIEALEFAKQVEAIVEKAGARHSKVDAARVQKLHDVATELGANCNGHEAAAKPEMTKGADLAKALEVANARIAALEKQPIPARHVSLRVVGKTADTGSSVDPDAALMKFMVHNPDGTVNVAASLVKYQQSLPGEPIDPRLRAPAAHQ